MGLLALLWLQVANWWEGIQGSGSGGVIAGGRSWRGQGSSALMGEKPGWRTVEEAGGPGSLEFEGSKLQGGAAGGSRLVLVWEALGTAVGALGSVPNFGHHVTQKDQLAENLKTRAQGKEETSDSYIQDVLHLCREVNPAMMENEIVAHLTKGISEEIYQSIIILDIATIEEFIKWCRKIEASNKKRVNKRVVFDRLPNVAAIDSADSESMEDLIRRIVREEVHRALNPESTTPEPSSLKEIIRERIEKNLAENLKTRAQGKEETSDSYIQDVLHLCREVNPAMMENEIVAHLTKGISEEIYQSIIILDIATIEEFIKWCRKIEASNKKRVNKRVVFDRLPNVAAIDSADSESMEDLIRRIVREEVHRALNPESTTPEPSSLKEIIRERIEKNVAAISKPIQRPPPRQSYPNQTRTFNQVPRPAQAMLSDIVENDDNGRRDPKDMHQAPKNLKWVTTKP
ncbi:ASPRV1 [Cordylochernes scorpioides]|uniref:ASPRV1 n=1 Tax=Cordylochernes scorpioides TaxID=51811 RepID=A0ABY6LHF5_9ARAC|nr:ASPRV1 [Cordylochernes scorpioides]